jgi:hypothetical protein
MSDEESTPSHGSLTEAIAGPEELPDTARNLHPIRLTSFVGVMMVIEFFDLLLTQRLHFAVRPDSTAGSVAKTVSISGNVLFASLLILALATVFISRRATPRFALYVMVTYLCVATVNVLINIGTLVVTPEVGNASQNSLILDLALVYSALTLIFSLWYQVADTHLPGGALDFPENAAKPDDPPKWFDYMCVAFFTNSTFGPTLEGVRTRPAKALMMFQTALSLVVLVVLVARIIKAP